jgi:phage repressor protein C with HTH and peptisase S24 domain
LGVETSKIQDRYVVPLFEGIHIDFMIPVRGSSMYPKYNSGDVVACRIIKDLLYVQWNKTYVIDTYTQGTILKRLKKSTTDDHVVCKSDNKDYDEFELPKKDIRNIAMVVGVIRLE